jgi:hypothetical protein
MMKITSYHRPLTLNILVSHRVIAFAVEKSVLIQSPIVIVTATMVTPGRIRICHPLLSERSYILPRKTVEVVTKPLIPQPVSINALVFKASREYRSYFLKNQSRTVDGLKLVPIPKKQHRGRRTDRHKKFLERKSSLVDISRSLPPLTPPPQIFHIDMGRFKPFKFKDSSISCATIDTSMRHHVLSHPVLRLPVDGLIIVPTPVGSSKNWARKRTKTRELEEWGLANLIVRTPLRTIPAWIINLITARFVRVVAGNGVYPAARSMTKNEENRSVWCAPHLGEWSHYDKNLVGPNGLRLTKDTFGQKDDGTSDAIKLFLRDFQKHLAPFLDRLLKQIDPLVWQNQQMIRQRVLALAVEDYKEWPIDFGGSFFCLALTHGSSSGIHTDRTDHTKSYAFVIPLGDFEGGDMETPSIGYRVPLRTGQILAFAASFLPHYVHHATGIRHSITAFTDKFTAIRTRDIMLSLGVSVAELNFKP